MAYLVAVNASITINALSCSGGALVVKRSTDPVRINNASGTVHVDGAGTTGLVLEGDKILFEPDGAGLRRITCGYDHRDSFTFYGNTPSATMNDASITLKTLSGETLVSTNLTVLWVDISMRCGQGESLSPDNDIALPYVLGMQIIPAITIVVNGEEYYRLTSMGCVAEFAGRVSPSNFTDEVTLVRDNVGECYGYIDTNGTGHCYFNPNITRETEPQTNDTGDPILHDNNPAPYGIIYDLDTPGIGLDPSAPIGRIYYARYNFYEYALFNGNRCSNDFSWFNRTTIQVISTNNVSTYQFVNRNGHNDDNLTGSGHDSLTVE